MKNPLLLPVTLGLCGAASVPVYGLDRPGDRANILLIHVDQHRYDCTQMTGRRNVSTPNLARLASEGMIFSNAFTPIPVSAPARQALLSGLWPERHKGLWNYDITFEVPEFDSPTWTEEMAKAGWMLGRVGTVHLHKTRTPYDYGFSEYVSEEEYARWRKGHGLPDPVNMNDGPIFGGYDPVGRDSTRTHWLARQTVEMIVRMAASGKPWHIRFDTSEPHLPCYPAREFYDMYDPAEIEPWGNFGDPLDGKPYIQRQQLLNWDLEDFTWEQWSRYVQRYFAMITQLDDAVGIILDGLDSLGLAENTLVIYTSDHGDEAGSHGMLDKHYTMYEEVVHIPFIARWPGVIRPGGVCDEFVIHELDMAQTFPEIAGLDFPTQGRSLLPLFRGESPAGWRQYAFSNYNGQQFGLFVQRMIRDRRWKYVWNMTDTDELYDLENDPWELNNLIHELHAAADLSRLRKALYEDLVERGDPVTRQYATRRQLLDGRKR